jgi:hypothetical protein
MDHVKEASGYRSYFIFTEYAYAMKMIGREYRSSQVAREPGRPGHESGALLMINVTGRPTRHNFLDAIRFQL